MAEPLPAEPPQKSTLDGVLSVFTDVRSGEGVTRCSPGTASVRSEDVAGADALLGRMVG